jgi:N,N'-diacetyllegionaminate synthase
MEKDMAKNLETLHIAGRQVGAGQPCFVIAEAGVNHNGDLHMARQLIDEAVRAGADAVKFQTFKAEQVMSAQAPKAAYQQEHTGADESQIDMVRKFELPFEAFRDLAGYSIDQGILFISTPFDFESADFLAELGVPAIKVPSGEVTNLPFLAHIARKKMPMILSTGMANLAEVDTAVRTIKAVSDSPFGLLHCVSSYPAAPEDANLRAMETMRAAFQVPVGYSDHTLGIEVALAAVALGGCIIEKHYTLDRSLPGPDHQASLEPDGLAELVEGIRTVEQALGHGRKEPVASEANTAEVARRSLVAARDIAAGSELKEEMVAVLRPGTGIPPGMREYLLGHKVARDVAAGSLFSFDMFN